METSQKQTLEYLLMINKVENNASTFVCLKNSNSVSKFKHMYIKQKKIKKTFKKDNK